MPTITKNQAMLKWLLCTRKNKALFGKKEIEIQDLWIAIVQYSFFSIFNNDILINKINVSIAYIYIYVSTYVFAVVK